MKQWCSILLGLILSIHVGYADNKIYTTDIQKLPVNSQQFLQTHFSDVKVSHISIERSWIGIRDYDVILTDGTEVEFMKSGEWKEVNRRGLEVPQDIVLPAIANYVKTNFPGSIIVAIEKDDRKLEVKLNNGLELNFSAQGQLRSIEH
jgi:hypothetical protein